MHLTIYIYFLSIMLFSEIPFQSQSQTFVISEKAQKVYVFLFMSKEQRKCQNTIPDCLTFKVLQCAAMQAAVDPPCTFTYILTHDGLTLSLIWSLFFAVGNLCRWPQTTSLWDCLRSLSTLQVLRQPMFSCWTPIWKQISSKATRQSHYISFPVWNKR